MSLTSLLSTFADETAKNCVNTAIFGEVCDNCNGSAVMQILAYVVRAMTIGVGILAVIGIMVFGIRYLTSHGNENLAIKARRHLFQVLLGLVSYIILVLAASWILPGNLTTTMLGGNPGTCPESTKTDISVISGNTDPTSPSSPSTDPSSPSSGWKSGTRPRECGPGTPGDFQTLTENGWDRFWTYTSSTGRVYVQYRQGDSAWKNQKLKGGSTMSSAGCCATSLAMIAQSFSSGTDYYPSPKSQDSERSGNTSRQGSTSCHGSVCNEKFDIIKSKIDAGGVVLVHATWGSSGTHWFLIVDYRTKDGVNEFFALNTDSVSSSPKWSGVHGTGWGTFGGSYNFTLVWRMPKQEWDCKVR